MADYHKYVFDNKRRKMVGEFEEMYKQEHISNFDSWHQEDSRHLSRQVSLAIIGQLNFRSIIDVGCGKGALTHLLKKRNNQVLGLDIAQTAIDIANSRFPDIAFKKLDINMPEKFSDLVSAEFEGERVDLIFASECLSYVKNWRSLLPIFSNVADYFLVSLHLPDQPIGFVKSPTELEREIAMHFDIIESIELKISKFIIIFAKTRVI